MISEWWIGKDLEENISGLIWRCYPGIRLEGLGKPTINLSQEYPISRPKLEPETSEYEAGMLTTQPRLSVVLKADSLNLFG
jgi:hypothetical protein